MPIVGMVLVLDGADAETRHGVSARLAGLADSPDLVLGDPSEHRLPAVIDVRDERLADAAGLFERLRVVAELPDPVVEGHFGALEIDRSARVVRFEGEERPITSHQFELLWALASRAGQVLSRDALMQLVRGEDLEAFDRSIDVHVSRIRQAIEADPRHPRRILTVRGVGYVFSRAPSASGAIPSGDDGDVPANSWK